MTNGEQMFLGHQNGSFLLNTWAPRRRDWVTDRPWRPDGPALVASAGDVRACGTQGLLLPLSWATPGFSLPWEWGRVAVNEELGPALISQQGMAQPAVFSLLGACQAGLRTYEPAQQFWAAVSEGCDHSPVTSFPTPLRGPCVEPGRGSGGWG